MTKIYLALQNYDYEGFDVMDAYATREGAEARVAMCREHKAKEPPLPDTWAPMTSPEWRAYAAEKDKWAAAAPEGFERGDSYEVMELDVVNC